MGNEKIKRVKGALEGIADLLQELVKELKNMLKNQNILIEQPNTLIKNSLFDFSNLYILTCTLLYQLCMCHCVKYSVMHACAINSKNNFFF